MSKEKQMMIVPPHHKESRIATFKDAEFIAKEASEMMLLAARIEQGRENFTDVFAIHHSQVSNDPIDFFIINPTNPTVIKEYGKLLHYVIINPNIIRHTDQIVHKKEGCLSFPKELNREVDRWNKIVVVYQNLEENDLGKFEMARACQSMNCDRLLAQIFQHEIDHAQAKFILKF